MVKNEKALKVIYSAIDDLNSQISEENRIEKNEATPLFGRSARLDSLELVKLIVAVEEKIKEEFGVSITLADEKAMSRETNPFETIGALAAYVSLLLEEKGRI